MGGCSRPLWSLHVCPTLCTCALQPCYLGGPPEWIIQQLEVQPGTLRHLLHPFGRFLSHDFGFGLRDAELGFFSFFMAGFPFAGARHAH